ncbi:MAG: hypothetical protein WCI67_22895, partial [Chloroflexales bacterium]
MTTKMYHWCGHPAWLSDFSLHAHRHLSAAHHRRYRSFFEDELLRFRISACQNCGADLYEAERLGDLRDLSGEANIGKALRAWQKARRKQVRPGRQPPANPPPDGLIETPPEALSNAVLPRCDAELRLDKKPDLCYTCGVNACASARPSPTDPPEEEPNVTAPAPSAPATQPAAPSPAARKLLARLTGQSPAGQSVLVTMEQAISAAATVFLNISTDGADAPTEKFLGVQKARANGRLLAIKKE